ncbi:MULTISPECIES: response regulator [unclassified Pseudonocardia]|jgi:CheY-like chemotaxis protein|uniref:response regulator n=1 Tax=unclassified Pseudonocardia TaxID=2619320 RepID=UPI00095ED9A5|nr:MULTISPECIES: response regulator [unclassified Pseudonocardia]MBN9100632.1 response regulator transcription factor [Pseudonocardia sp.]OJY47674.1 MAG: response regulator [Pseudonocardia sp. 73-21]
MESDGLRILIASTLGGIVAPRFRAEFTPGTVTVAVGEQQVREAITESLRFDVVLTDLLWNDTELEYTFDGLDVLDLVATLGRPAPVLLAAQGHGVENDHLDEAVVRDGVAGVVRKADGVEGLVPALRQVAAGRSLAPTPAPSSRVSVHAYFGAGRRGETAGRMAGAIASGRAVNYDTLATAAGCSRNTAIKIADKYLGPLIRERGEHPDDLPLSTQVVYRWCGEHSRYLVSWCRRHGHADVLGSGSGHTRS